MTEHISSSREEPWQTPGLTPGLHPLAESELHHGSFPVAADKFLYLQASAPSALVVTVIEVHRELCKNNLSDDSLCCLASLGVV